MCHFLEIGLRNLYSYGLRPIKWIVARSVQLRECDWNSPLKYHYFLEREIVFLNLHFFSISFVYLNPVVTAEA